MSQETPKPAGAPAVLRQDGPHRVTVAPGAHSALAPSAGVGTKRLRPAVGAAPLPRLDSNDAQATAALDGRRRSPRDSSSTEIRRLPGTAAVKGRFAPGQEETLSPAPRPSTAALEARLASLARLNQETSATVTAFEQQIKTPLQDPTAPATGRLRGLFRRSSP